MKRRCDHRRELGSIACSELNDVGAEKQGWLSEDNNILIALEMHFIAIATRSFALLLNWSHLKNHPDPPLKIRPDMCPIEAEYISALQWIVFDDFTVLSLGTSCGYLLFYSLQGLLIHKQIVNNGRILKLRVRETKRDLSEDASPEELCVVMPTAIARFDGSDIKRTLHRWFQGRHSDFYDQDSNSEDPETSFARIPYQLWNVSTYGLCSDAAITGIMPPPLIELQGSQVYYCAITIGHDAVISAYRLSEDRSRSIVGAILSNVVPAAFSTISSISNMIFFSGQAQQKKPEVKPQSFSRASPLTCLEDYPRKGERLTLSPSGTLAAITDSLGRILLLDTQALAVVRLWKGYRDANCLFLEILDNENGASRLHHEHVNSDYCLCLAIHAPRKGIIEVWQMRNGPRLLTIPCPKGSKILQPTYRFSSSMGSPLAYLPLELFILNGDSGQISVLNRFVYR
ncbi:G-protein modulator [Lithospermum erythrorhizon]|uniref:G-protein modulator n=1 Tax=Lithospermum erythrorhizon TaxID=34254 RepID=A0AAV3PQ90_LITER